ncbi:MAG: DUF2141 domain-containing protein [Mucispirillum sp.]|nr:DUF2141 domain-containing protein [Mucispirillum sp.]
MKYIKLIIIILLLFQSIYAFAEDERVVMVLEVNNIETSTGNIMIHLCRNQQEFLGSVPVPYAFFFPAKKNTVTAKITIPKGIYAVKIFHDANENKVLDLNAANHPVEKFGFSNNFFGSYSELPPYEKVLISIEKAENFVRINLR